jgi:ABC-2 type transport system permease protein
MPTDPQPIAMQLVPMPRARIFRAYLQEARCEVLRYLRTPGFLLPTLMFPAAFYLMFGVVMAPTMHPEAPRYLLASYATFGVMAPGLFGFGVSLAMEREGGLLRFKRAMPMPPMAYLAGKMVMATAVAAVIAVMLMALAVGVAHVALSPAQAAALLLTATLGVLPFCALGLLVGTLANGQGAPAVVNLIYLPMAFLSGLWFPIDRIEGLRQIAPAWPAWHLNQLSLAAVGFPHAALLPSVLALGGFTAVFLWIAARRLRRHG